MDTAGAQLRRERMGLVGEVLEEQSVWPNSFVNSEFEETSFFPVEGCDSKQLWTSYSKCFTHAEG